MGLAAGNGAHGNGQWSLAEGLGLLEFQVLDILWTGGRATLPEITAEMRSRHVQSQHCVLHVLRHLVERGVLSRDACGEVAFYSPTMGREQFGMKLVASIVDIVFHGNTSPVADYLLGKASSSSSR